MQDYHKDILCVTEYHHETLAFIYAEPPSHSPQENHCAICGRDPWRYVSGYDICHLCIHNSVAIHRYGEPAALTKQKSPPQVGRLAVLSVRARDAMAVLTIYTPLVYTRTWNGRCQLCLKVPCNMHAANGQEYPLCDECIQQIGTRIQAYHRKNTIIHAYVYEHLNNDVAKYLLGFSLTVCAMHTA